MSAPEARPRRGERVGACALIGRSPRSSSDLSLGALASGLSDSVRAGALGVAGFIGTLWLNALKMTVIPLVVALLVVGIAKSA